MDLSHIEAIMESRVYPKWAERIRKSILDNFRHGGRPTKWKKSRRAEEKGEKTLVDKAHLQNSITVNRQGNTFIAGTSMIYAAAHNFGTQINPKVTPKMKRFAWYRYHKTKEDMWKGLALTKKDRLNINLPKREFMMLQKSDFKYFEQTLIQELSK